MPVGGKSKAPSERDDSLSSPCPSHNVTRLSLQVQQVKCVLVVLEPHVEHGAVARGRCAAVQNADGRGLVHDEVLLEAKKKVQRCAQTTVSQMKLTFVLLIAAICAGVGGADSQTRQLSDIG